MIHSHGEALFRIKQVTRGNLQARRRLDQFTDRKVRIHGSNSDRGPDEFLASEHSLVMSSNRRFFPLVQAHCVTNRNAGFCASIYLQLTVFNLQNPGNKWQATSGRLDPCGDIREYCTKLR